MLYALDSKELRQLCSADWTAEFPDAEVLTAVFRTDDNTMMPGKVVGRVWNPLAFAKHAFYKVDITPVKLGYVEISEETGPRR